MLAVSACVGCLAVHLTSRAGKVRAYERRLSGDVGELESRMATQEARTLQFVAAMEGLVDNAKEMYGRAEQSRKRATAAAQPRDQAPDLAQLTPSQLRSHQLSQVRDRLRGRGVG